MIQQRQCKIFVFGSNLAGRHGAGSAAHAVRHYKANIGCGIGPTGDAYAIPTKDNNLRTLPLEQIELHVKDFLYYAKMNPNLEFQVVAIGCGLAGYDASEIAPMFRDAPGNCELPKTFKEILRQ